MLPGQTDPAIKCPPPRGHSSQLVLIDFDSVKYHNLDRLLHATTRDIAAARSKVQVMAAALKGSAVNSDFTVDALELSVVEPSGLAAALDCDVLFSCVDRPWPRHVLNLVAYAHLIPVVDGGIRATVNDGRWLGADWKAHVAAPTRRCLACLGQYEPAAVALERDGLLDDPSYLAGLSSDHPLKARENVFGFSMNTASLQVLQFISMVAAPQDIPDLGGQIYHAVSGNLDHDLADCAENCPYQHELVASADGSPSLTGPHAAADREREERERQGRSRRVRMARLRQRAARRIAGAP